MEARSDRKNNQTDWVLSVPDEIHPTITGDGGVLIADCFAPNPSEIRHMLLTLRRKLRWSQKFAAMVLGITPSAIVKWEAGDREPNGCAAKLIFLLYSQLVENSGKVKNAWDLAFWGRIPCRNSMVELIAISGPFFVPEAVIAHWLSAVGAAVAQKAADVRGASVASAATESAETCSGSVVV